MEADSHINLMRQISTTDLNLAAASLIVVGLLYCFLGYRLVKFIIGLTGFILAGGAAGALLAWISNDNAIITGIGFLVGGIAGVFALYFVYRVGVFLIGFLGICLVAHNILADRPENWIPFAILGAGILGGIAALFIERPAIIAATAAIGAWLVLCGTTFFLLGDVAIEEWERAFIEHPARWFVFAAWAFLSVFGVWIQRRAGKKSKD